MKRSTATLAALLAATSLVLFSPTTPVKVVIPVGCAPVYGLTGWWTGDSTTADEVGGRTAVLKGDAGFTQGLIGDAFFLDGDGDFIDVPDHPTLNVGTKDFSIEMWVKFNSFDEPNQILAEKWVEKLDPSSTGWTFQLSEGDKLAIFGAGSQSVPLDLPTGEWLHVAAVRDGFFVSIYLNGQIVGGPHRNEENNAPPNLDSSSSLKFGHRGNGTDTPGSNQPEWDGMYLDGRIDDVGYYVGYALTEEEIRAIYLAGSNGKCIDSFTDDDGNIFEADIEWLAAKGITKGCNPPSNTLFCPDDFVTRGQMAAFLVRALGYTDDGGGDLFVDDDGNTFEADIDKLATAGVTKGCNPPANTEYCPGDFVTRGQMAAFLVRALGYIDDGGGDLFTDDDGNTFEADIDKLATAGVTKGCNPPANTEYCPGAFVTRGQMAAFLHRALGP